MPGSVSAVGLVSGERSTLAAIAAAVATCVVVVGLLCRRRKLPGRLRPRGTFEHEDPAAAEAVAERKRDFARIAATRRDIWVFTDGARLPGAVLPMEPPSRGQDDQGIGPEAAYERLKFWLQGELGKIPGAIDLGLTSRWPVLDRVVSFISVSPGFDFIMRHQVLPMTYQCKYLLMISKSGQVRAAWYAFVSDRATPGATSGPFVVKLVSENLNAARDDGRTYTCSRFSARPTAEKDMEKIVAAHAPLIARGIARDDWEPLESV
eukprot:TRINITY_DN34341_c0_g1_i1.p1 TRINITY_DN34341_c0_g1~~TRINITY_DN34341_c0_g1_i1.p1  ORF type:complete len:264 (-),score=54.18 TRINITY_DN34341_c0_g1_i1:2-793(-)